MDVEVIREIGACILALGIIIIGGLLVYYYIKTYSHVERKLLNKKLELYEDLDQLVKNKLTDNKD